MDAYDTSTIKGCTTYRAGTMTSVLAAPTNEADHITKVKAPKRPDSLDCDINIVKAEGSTWMVLVGLYKDAPFEVFAFKQTGIRFTSKLQKGQLIKVFNDETKENEYNLQTELFAIYNLKNYFDTPEQESLTRMISLNLKHGTDISTIYHQLQKAKGSVVSFSKAIARTLTRYVTEWKETMCHECNDPDGLVFQEGCLKCKNCGYSKCI